MNSPQLAESPIHATAKNVWLQAGSMWGGVGVLLMGTWFFAVNLTAINSKLDDHHADLTELKIQNKEDRTWIQSQFEEVKQRLSALEASK